MIEKRSACVLVFNTSGQLALQLRAQHDDFFPLHWDFSAAGGIEEGESPEEAASRELWEEIGVEAPIELIAQLECVFPEWRTMEMTKDNFYLYKTVYDGPFSIDPNEVQTIQFLNLSTIGRMVKLREKFHPEFVTCWNTGLITQAAAM